MRQRITAYGHSGEMASARIGSLDVLRGIAILGTLATNIWIFTNPEGLVGYANRTAPGEGDLYWTAKVLQQLAQGKFLGLLTIMFGIGLAIQQQSAARRGVRWPGSYPWRAALLFVDGVVHFVLVVEFDVLMGYAVTGLVVAYLLVRSERAQRRWMWSTGSFHVALLALATVAILAAPASDERTQHLEPNPYADGSWWDLVLFRLDHALLFRVEPIFIFAMSIALFLAGARLFRAGVFEPEGHRIRVRLMIGALVATPIDLALGLSGNDAGFLLARYFTASIIAFGILGLVGEFYARRSRVGFAGRRLAEVGRMALSSYILQNIIASTICYGWGLGLASAAPDDARVPFTVGVYAIVCVLIMTFAHLWLARFERGPVEWLWNASYLRITRRAEPAGSTARLSP
jgi:uncharacterized protein